MHRTFLLTILLLPLPARSQAPDTVFLHGRILTGNGLHADARAQHPEVVQAIAVRDGHVTAIGSDAVIGALAGPATKRIDLHGAFAMPGFNDAHVHLAMAGQQQLALNLEGTRSLAEMQARIRRYVAQLPPATPAGTWLTGGGWDQTLWASQTLPTREDIDAVSDGHPALLLRVDGHIAVANTAALAAAGLSAASPDPNGGRYDRQVNEPLHGADPQLGLTGIVREASALAPIQAVIPPPSLPTRRRALEIAMADAIAHGVTSLQDNSMLEDWLAFEEMEHRGQLRVRIAEWLPFDLPVPVLRERRASHPADDPLLHLTQLKGFLDGSLGSRTAALSEPYADDPSNAGLPRYAADKLNQMAAERAAAGFQMGFHAIGDLANTMALDAYATAEQAGEPASEPRTLADPADPDAGIVTAPRPGASTPAAFRFRIEHAQVLLPGDFDRFASLGVIASMQPSHLLTDMAWAPARLGPERVHAAYAWHRFLDHGVTLAFGTDYPVEAINPFRGLYAATTRRNEAGTRTFDPATAAAEVLTLDEALYAYTQAPAYAEFREQTKGKLVPGYMADMVVLDRDLLELPPPFTHPAAAQQLLHTRVLRTFVGGREVYSADATPVVEVLATHDDHD